MLLTLCAFSSMDMGDAAQAEEYLKQARDQAARFDAAPDCTMEHLRFIVPNQSAAYDDFGATAADGIRQLLEENREDWQETPCIRLTVDQTGAEDGKILSTLWLRQVDSVPLRGEIAVDGEIILTADFTSFSFYGTIQDQE